MKNTKLILQNERRCAEPSKIQVFLKYNSLRNAFNELNNNHNEACINWLIEAQKENIDNIDASNVIQNLLDKLKESEKLKNDVYDYLDNLFIELYDKEVVDYENNK